jgi:hypothetical protein
MIARFYNSIFYKGSCPGCQYQPEADVPATNSGPPAHGGPYPPQAANEETASRHKSASAGQDPGGRGRGSEILRSIFSGWELSGVTTFQSGTPFSVINQGSSTIGVLDNAGIANGLVTGSYPDVVGNPYGTPSQVSGNTQSFGPLLGNPAAYAAPQGLTFGNAGRNSLNNPHRTNFDMSLLRTFRVWGERSLQFRIDAFNVFNHTQFEIYDPVRGNTGSNMINCYGPASTGYSAAGGGGTNCLTGSSFLHPIDAHAPRTLQLGAKFSF